MGIVFENFFQYFLQTQTCRGRYNLQDTQMPLKEAAFPYSLVCLVYSQDNNRKRIFTAESQKNFFGIIKQSIVEVTYMSS